MPQYIILLYDDPKKFAEFSLQEMQEAFKKYHGWGLKMREQGRLIGSNKLTDGAGRVLRGKSPMRVTDGPFTEGKEVLGGYYMFNADSYEHAIELTRDHPQLEYGGTLEVREIQDLSQAAAMPESSTNIASVVDHLFRSSAGQMVSYLTRVLGPAHLDLAEEAVQDALAKALQTWPFSGIPDNPPGWLLHVARNRALDLVRHRGVVLQKTSEVVAELSQPQLEPRLELPEALRDDELCMIFLACNPALPRDSRVALSLKAVSGFSVKEIARAFLCDPATIAQRLVRAKRQIREQGFSFELPPPHELGKALDSVLEVIYLLFNEGYAAHEGDDLIRHDLCSEALRLALLVADSPVSQPKAHALVSLLAFQGARLAARIDDNGELVLLQDQDRSKWDSRLIALGARHLAMSAEGEELSQFHVQAAIASIHAQAKDPSTTDWEAILDLYDDLMTLNPSSVVALNRVIALGKVHGPECALDELTAIQDDSSLRDYYLLPSTRASLLAETGEFTQAANHFEAALRRPCSEPERRFLTRRMQECRDQALRLPKPS